METQDIFGCSTYSFVLTCVGDESPLETSLSHVTALLVYRYRAQFPFQLVVELLLTALPLRREGAGDGVSVHQEFLRVPH